MTTLSATTLQGLEPIKQTESWQTLGKRERVRKSELAREKQKRMRRETLRPRKKTCAPKLGKERPFADSVYHVTFFSPAPGKWRNAENALTQNERRRKPGWKEIMQQ